MLITKAQYLISSPSIDLCPKPDRPEYAFIGRSNVGKSSLINMLCNQQKLAKTSASPGKTQMINHFTLQSRNDAGKIEQWYLVDLPGYGYAKVAQTQRKQWAAMIEKYITQRENLLQLFVLIDARHEPQQIDVEFIHQIGRWQIPFSIVFTKADKVTQKVVAANVKLFLDTLSKTWQFLPRTFVTSAEKHLGKKQILGFIGETNEHYFNRELLA